MLYDDKIATVYGVANGFVVEVREERKQEKKSSEKDACSPCCGPSYDTKTYTAKNETEVMKIIKNQMASKAAKQFSDAFDEAVKAK